MIFFICTIKTELLWISKTFSPVLPRCLSTLLAIISTSMSLLAGRVTWCVCPVNCHNPWTNHPNCFVFSDPELLIEILESLLLRQNKWQPTCALPEYLGKKLLHGHGTERKHLACCVVLLGHFVVSGRLTARRRPLEWGLIGPSQRVAEVSRWAGHGGKGFLSGHLINLLHLSTPKRNHEL